MATKSTDTPVCGSEWYQSSILGGAAFWTLKCVVLLDEKVLKENVGSDVSPQRTERHAGR